MLEKFKSIIENAIYEIPENYFRQPTVKPDFVKYGERVFCYEFYHQIRNFQKEFSNLEISAEAVKSKVQYETIADKAIPDLLIHNFGIYGNNEVVIEVKTSSQSFYSGVLKDFQMLDFFTDSLHKIPECNFKLGILLVVNENFQNFVNNYKNEHTNNEIKELLKSNSRIEVWNIISPSFINGKLKNNSVTKYSNIDLRIMYKLNN